MLLANPPQNMIAQSQSGTGKTAAFVLAMLSRVDTSKNYVQVSGLSCRIDLKFPLLEPIVSYTGTLLIADIRTSNTDGRSCGENVPVSEGDSNTIRCAWRRG